MVFDGHFQLASLSKCATFSYALGLVIFSCYLLFFVISLSFSILTVLIPVSTFQIGEESVGYKF